MYSKFEYKREITNGGVISGERLNELGAQGWEGYDHEGNVYFFKRQEAVDANSLAGGYVSISDKTPLSAKKPKGK